MPIAALMMQRLLHRVAQVLVTIGSSMQDSNAHMKQLAALAMSPVSRKAR
jgi:hypothetical protein